MTKRSGHHLRQNHPVVEPGEGREPTRVFDLDMNIDMQNKVKKQEKQKWRNYANMTKSCKKREKQNLLKSTRMDSKFLAFFTLIATWLGPTSRKSNQNSQKSDKTVSGSRSTPGFTTGRVPSKSPPESTI